MSNPVPIPQRTVQLQTGDVVVAPTKNPFTSTAVWGLIVMCVTAAARKYLPEDFQGPAVDTALEVIQWGVGLALVLWGRKFAGQQLGFGGLAQHTIKCLLPLFLLPAMVGCMSRQEHAAVREGLIQARSVADEEHQQWSAIIAGDNNQDGRVTEADGKVDLSALPQLGALSVSDRQTWLSARNREHEEYQKLIDASRANDDFFGK